MSLQRRRGKPIVFYWPTEVVDRRGNKVKRPLGESVVRRAVRSFERSNRAELPGQQGIEQYNMIVDLHTTAPLWTVAFWDDAWWDVAAPPAKRDGRRVDHLTVTIRRRPDRPDV